MTAALRWRPTAALTVAATFSIVSLGQAQTTAPQASPQPAAAQAVSGIAFDQIDRVMQGSERPPLDGFAADLETITYVRAHPDSVNTAAKDGTDSAFSSAAGSVGTVALSMIPFVGGFLAGGVQQAQAAAHQKQMKEKAEQAQKLMEARRTAGKLTSFAFYGGWSRTDLSPTQVIIAKPEQHLRIYLNPEAKTYRTFEFSQSDANGPLTATTVAATGGGAAEVLIETHAIDTPTIAGQLSQGYSRAAAITLTQASGSCHEGSMQVKHIEYVSELLDPAPQLSALGKIEARALPAGCVPAITRSESGAAIPSGKLYLYRAISFISPDGAASAAGVGRPSMPLDLSSPEAIQASISQMASSAGTRAAMQSQQSAGNAPEAMTMTIFSERSNFRALTAADAALFEIPQGYALEK